MFEDEDDLAIAVKESLKNRSQKLGDYLHQY